jgi:hypothetical protein
MKRVKKGMGLVSQARKKKKENSHHGRRAASMRGLTSRALAAVVAASMRLRALPAGGGRAR